MSPIVLMFVLLLAGLILLAAELFLPAQGVLGVLGGASLLASIGVGFWINQWLGAGLLTVALIASPFAATAAINLWPKTPLGRRIVLTPDPSAVTPPTLAAGQVGIALSELRPTGEIEVAGRRVEARSDRGIIAAGSAVRVVGLVDGSLVVREQTENSA